MLSVRKRTTVLAARMLQSVTGGRTNVKRRIPNGCLFAPLQGGHQITYPHPLDDEAGYRRFLKGHLLEECAYFAHEFPSYRDYMIKMLEYTLPAFDTCWTFGPELIYRYVAPKEHQTDENIWKCRILRACVDLKFASSAVLDDITDHSDVRMGKPAWKMVSPGRLTTVIYDGQQLDALPYFLVKKHFQDSPGYSRLLETLSKVSLNGAVVTKATLDLLVGQTLDNLSRTNTEGSSPYASCEDISLAKAGRFVAMQPHFGLLHAGVLDEEILMKADRLFCETGILIQNWDDFCDYYCTSSLTGKPCNDSKNAGTTWASSVAMEHFSEDQKIAFKEVYGSEDPEKLEVVRQLYDSIDLPNLYIDYTNEKNLECHRMIKDFNHRGLEEACCSWLQWLLGDVLKT